MKVRNAVIIVVVVLFVFGETVMSSVAQDLFAPPAKGEYEQRKKALVQQRQALELQQEAWEQQKQAAALARDREKFKEISGFGQIRVYGNRVSTQVNTKIRQATEAIRNAKNDESRAEAENTLREVLDRHFEQDMSARNEELQNIQARLQKLHVQLDRRREKKQEIIDLRVKVALNEADGLGFFGDGAETGRLGNTPVGMGRTMQGGGMGGGRGGPGVIAAPASERSSPTTFPDPFDPGTTTPAR